MPARPLAIDPAYHAGRTRVEAARHSQKMFVYFDQRSSASFQ